MKVSEHHRHHQMGYDGNKSASNSIIAILPLLRHSVFNKPVCFAGRRLSSHCNYFVLPETYANIINNLKMEPATHDFVHVALAKILHCIKDKEFSSAKSFLYYLQVNVLFYKTSHPILHFCPSLVIKINQ